MITVDTEGLTGFDYGRLSPLVYPKSSPVLCFYIFYIFYFIQDEGSNVGHDHLVGTDRISP
jgi:hypothetical protein